MRTKPIIFNILWLFFLATAISLPLQVLFLYEHDFMSFYEWKSVFMKLTPLNWLVMITTIVNGILCFKASTYIKYTIPASIFFVAINNFFVGAWGVDFNLLLTWSATLFYGIISYSYVYAHGLEAIENPERQWWKIPQRTQKSYPVWIEWQGKRKLLAKTFDISKTGAFISTISQSSKLIPAEVKIGESVRLILGTSEGDLSLGATIVRKEEQARGNYPVGLGVHFNGVGLTESIRLRRALAASY